MRVVAENGLPAFSMKKVTNLAGVSEALIYKHFETKEKLLYLCFETVHRQIAALFDKMEIPPLQAPQEIYEAVRAMWMTYFSFLVQNSYRTIYYFEYRDSRYIRQMLTIIDIHGIQRHVPKLENIFLRVKINLLRNKHR